MAVVLGCMMEVSLRPVPAAQALYRPGRELASLLFGPGGHVLKALLSGLWSFLALPWLVLALPAVLHRLLGASKTWFGSIGSYARFFIPMSFAGLLPFALMKAPIPASKRSPRIAKDCRKMSLVRRKVSLLSCAAVLLHSLWPTGSRENLTGASSTL